MLRGTETREKMKKKEKKSNDIQRFIYTYVYIQNHANVPLKTYFDGDSNSP